MTTTQVPQLTERKDAMSALNGLVRLVAGYANWEQVQDLLTEDRLAGLTKLCLDDLQRVNDNPAGLDGKALGQLTRKLKAYQQLTTLQNVLQNEVEW